MEFYEFNFMHPQALRKIQMQIQRWKQQKKELECAPSFKTFWG
jgi:hypothetical protein